MNYMLAAAHGAAEAEDGADPVLDRVVSLEALGVRFQDAGSNVSVRGNLEGLSDADRAWIKAHEAEIHELVAIPSAAKATAGMDLAEAEALIPPNHRLLLKYSGSSPYYYGFLCRYNVKTPMIITGPINPERLQQALDWTLRLHPALATRFSRSGDQYRRWFSDEAITINLLPVADEEDWRLAFQKDLNILGDRAHDMNGGALVRATMLALPDGRHAFQLEAHHLVIDHVAVQAVLRDLIRCYLNGPPSAEEVDKARTDYLRYLAWEYSRPLARRRSLAEARWRRWLAGVPEGAASFRLDGPRLPEGNLMDRRCTQSIDAEVLWASGQAARSMKVSLPSLLMGAFFCLLARHSGHSTVVAAVAEEGRRLPEFWSLCEFMAISLPLSVEIQPGDSFRVVVERVQRTVAEEKQEPTTLAMLERAFLTRPKVLPWRIANVMVTIITEGADGATTAGPLEIGRIDQYYPDGLSPMNPDMPLDVLLQLRVRPGRAVCDWYFNSRILRPETMAAIHREYVEMIRDFISDPAAPVNISAD